MRVLLAPGFFHTDAALLGQRFSLCEIFKHAHLKFTVYGHKQASIHTHMRNAVTLMWGSQNAGEQETTRRSVERDAGGKQLLLCRNLLYLCTHHTLSHHTHTHTLYTYTPHSLTYTPHTRTCTYTWYLTCMPPPPHVYTHTGTCKPHSFTHLLPTCTPHTLTPTRRPPPHKGPQGA